jgi:hypothetical protein
MRHLQDGGRVLLGTSEVARAIWDTPLYRDVLGLEYVRSWNRSFDVRVRGAEGIAADKDVTILPSRKGESITVFAPRDGAGGVEPFCTLPDGQVVGAKIARRDPTTGKEGRAVVFGFFLADVQDAALRRALLKDAVAFLERGEKAEPRTLPRIEARVEAPTSRPLKEVPAAATGTGL